MISCFLEIFWDGEGNIFFKTIKENTNRYTQDRAANCEPCMAGTFSLEGQPICIPCLPGTFSHEGQGICTPCDKGYFSESNGMGECLPCPQGTATNLVYKLFSSSLSSLVFPSSPPISTCTPCCTAKSGQLICVECPSKAWSYENVSFLNSFAKSHILSMYVVSFSLQ